MSKYSYFNNVLSKACFEVKINLKSHENNFEPNVTIFYNVA
jgi:hypothetical protein